MIFSQPNTHARAALALNSRSRTMSFFMGVALVAATFAAHFPAIQGGYIWDDNTALHESPIINAPNGLYRFWFTKEAPDYWPLSATTLWIEWRLWGNNPSPYHVTSIMLHGLAAVVLWRLLKRLNFGRFGAFLGGVLLAVHPLTVASTAWIAERKNVLSLMLYLLSILAYLRFDDERQPIWYALALLAGAAALLAKASVVALPVVLLLLIWWRHRAITTPDFLRISPFLLLSLSLGLVTVWFQHHNAISGVEVRPEGLASRIASVGWIYWFYLYKFVVPINLAMVYPRWHIDGGNVLSFVPLSLLMMCFIILWLYRNRWSRGLLVALGSFVIALAPVAGIMTMAFSRYSLVADHLQYPGLPGLIAFLAGSLAAAISWAQRTGRRPWATAITVLAGAIVLTLAVLTWRQAETYKDALSLWSHCIEVNDQAWVAYYNRGVAYGTQHLNDSAIEDYTKAIALKPDYALAYNNRGLAFGEKGDFDREIQDCTKAIEIKPDYADAYNNRGYAYHGKENHARAIQEYSKAIELKPTFAACYLNRALAYAAMKAHDLTISDCDHAIRLMPNRVEAYSVRANAYAQKGNIQQAILAYSQVLVLDPKNSEAYNNRAAAYFGMKEYDKAWFDIKNCRRVGGTPHPAFLQALAQASGRTE